MLSQIHRRNTDLMAAIRREAKKAGVKELRGRVLNRIVDRALEGGAPHFYVSYERALEVIHRHRPSINGSTRSLRVRMWDDIRRLAEEEMADDPESDIYQAISRVLFLSPAPHFYISRATALGIYHTSVAYERMRNEKQRRLYRHRHDINQ